MIGKSDFTVIDPDSEKHGLIFAGETTSSEGVVHVAAASTSDSRAVPLI